MKKRWTIKELAAVNDAQFTMEILRERRSELSNLYSPLAQRLASVINTLGGDGCSRWADGRRKEQKQWPLRCDSTA